VNQAGTVEPCYALRLAQAFLPLVPRTDEAVAAVVDDLKDRDPDERIPIAQAHVLLEAAVSLAGDPSLGLKAGRSMYLGDAGIVDYAMQSPGTVQDAIENAGRFIRLLNDALVIRTELASDRAIVRL
jgi:Arabinose-binding domain of AraC transcription regulator, N-term